MGLRGLVSASSARFLVTVLIGMVAPEVHGMTALTQRELNDAQEAASAELKSLRETFHIAVRERLAITDEPDRTSFEVETLPGAEVSRPWVLHAAGPETLNASADVLDVKNIGSFESAQLSPSDRSGDSGRGF